MNRKHWTTEDIETLIKMRTEGFTYENIAQKLGRTVSSVLMKGSRLMTPEMRQKENKPWTPDDTFKLISMCEEGFRIPEIAKILDRTDISIKLKLADLRKKNLVANVNRTLDRSKPTKLYLLYFTDEDFYKVGITQQQISARFSGYPNYIVVDQLEYSTRDEAEDCEGEIINKVTKYVPETFGRHNYGKTECFKSNISLSSLEQLI